MTQKRYIVKLTDEERVELHALISKGKGSASKLLKARILLKADEASEGGGWTDQRIIEALDTNESMVYRTRRTLVEHGFSAVLNRKKRQTGPIARIVDGDVEAELITLACSDAPDGRSRWTLQLLADELMARGTVAHISDMTVHRTLKKMSLNRT